MEAQRETAATLAPSEVAKSADEAGGSVGAGQFPAQRVWRAKHEDYHMISDHQLQTLLRPEASDLGNLGFALGGVALGLLPSSVSLFHLAYTEQERVTTLDLFTLLLFGCCAAGATACLALFKQAKNRNTDTAATIRAQKTEHTESP